MRWRHAPGKGVRVARVRPLPDVPMGSQERACERCGPKGGSSECGCGRMRWLGRPPRGGTIASVLQSPGIDRMRVEERIVLATAIWESIAAEPHPHLISEAQRQERARRLADHSAHPAEVVPWEQVKAEALTRYKRCPFRSSSSGLRKARGTGTKLARFVVGGFDQRTTCQGEWR